MKRLLLISLMTCLMPGGMIGETVSVLPDTALLGFRFKNINFMRDNEYANPLTEGYTLLGFLIQPSFVYSPVPVIKMSLGVQLQSYAGAASINSPVLIFSTSFRLTRKTTLVLGTLDGCEKHRLDDPVFYRERMYTAQTESGLRLFSEDEHLFLDIWVNWENFVFKNDTTREKFFIGVSFNYLSPGFLNGFSLEVPLQMVFRHLGGQISNYPEHVETFYDGSVGLKLNYDISGGRGGRLSLEYKQLRFQYISAHGEFSIKYGDASWIRLNYNIGQFRFGTWYWRGHDFYAPEGNPIYSSVSERTPGLIVPDRSVWTTSAGFTIHPVKFFELYAGAESYFDLRSNHLDAALMLHMRFDQTFTLKKFR